MIPKIIHYCWFGGNPLPDSAVKCIDSWKKYFPDYEIKEWNESNFDVNMIPYTAEAYRLKKYAFVSDYARFYVLYRYGGLYFDTDVEVIKNMDDIIARGPFMGCEPNGYTDQVSLTDNKDKFNNGKPLLGVSVAPGLGLGVNPGLGLFKSILKFYESHHFTDWLGVRQGNVVSITTDILKSFQIETKGNGIMKCGPIYVYSPEYFCPKNYYTGELSITKNTVSIHHYSATWVPKQESILEIISRKLSFSLSRLLTSLRIYKTPAKPYACE